MTTGRPTAHTTITSGETVEIDLAGSGFKVRVEHVLTDDGHAIQLRGVDCDLDGDQPGLYYLHALGTGEWPGALTA